MDRSAREARHVTAGLFGKGLMALRALATRTATIDCGHMSFVFEDVPLRKILNWILVEASISAKPEKPW